MRKPKQKQKEKKRGRLKAFFRRVIYADKRHYAAVGLLAFSVSLLFLRYRSVFCRLVASFADLGTSFVYWACNVFELPYEAAPTVAVLERVDMSALPLNLDAVREKFLSFGLEFFNWEFFKAYNIVTANRLYHICLLVSVLAPVLLMLGITLEQVLFSKRETKAGKKSLLLSAAMRAERRILFPVIRVLRNFAAFLNAHRGYVKVLAFLWLLNINAVTIVLEVIAFYYYFLIAFNIPALLTGMLKLFIDLLIMWFTLPLPVWLVLFWLVFDHNRKRKGYEELKHQEARNCGFLKSAGYISIVVGAPGVGKTAFVTDAALSWVNIYKEESKELIADDLLTFPDFPFLCFEQDIREGITENRIFNLPSAEQFAKDIWQRFQESRNQVDLYGYDYIRFGLEKNLGNRMETLENTLKEHAKAYFIYLCENPNLSNYPIRFDGKFDDSKYFPVWKNDFFKSEPEKIKEKSVYSHILDQDLMRMGKTVKEFNPRAGTFGFGIYTNTEWAKSRGNNLTLQGVDKDAEEANQKNDLYEYAHKMCRHASTMVRGKVFFRFIGDEQRPRSLGVDLRDLGSVLSVESKSDLRLTMPHFVIGEMLYDWLYKPLLKTYFRWINLRGDETLFSYFCLKKPLSCLSVYYRKIYNIFGTYDLEIKKEKGTSYSDTPGQSEAEYCRYFLMPKKIYADRYNSDCYEQFFAKRQMDSGKGINDLPTYEGLGMNLDEMKEQNDYFLMQLMAVFAGEELPAAKTKRRKQKTKQTVQPVQEPEEQAEQTGITDQPEECIFWEV